MQFTRAARVDTHTHSVSEGRVRVCTHTLTQVHRCLATRASSGKRNFVRQFREYIAHSGDWCVTSTNRRD